MKAWFRKRRGALAVGAAWLVLGVLIGFAIGHASSGQKNSSLRGSIVRLGGYDLISPLLACDVGQEEVFTELTPIRNTVESLIGTAKAQGKATSVSVYLRTLNKARWLEVNGGEK